MDERSSDRSHLRADPIREWRRDPFGGDLVDGAVYGRGASDDKGQVLGHLKAVEAWLRSPGGLPVNVASIMGRLSNHSRSPE